MIAHPRDNPYVFFEEYYEEEEEEEEEGEGAAQEPAGVS